MAGPFEALLKATDLIADVRRAFTRIESLEQAIAQLTTTCNGLDARLRETEAGLRVARAEIKLEAVQATQGIVNGVQGGLYGQIAELALRVDRLTHQINPTATRLGSPDDR